MNNTTHSKPNKLIVSIVGFLVLIAIQYFGVDPQDVREFDLNEVATLIIGLITSAGVWAISNKAS